MDFLTLLLLSLGLAMDAFAVSVSNAMCFKNFEKRQEVAAAACFGIFQGAMPVIGFFVGRIFSGFITAVDHWLVLVLLGFIGGKMVWDAIQAMREPEACPVGQTFTTKIMLLQAVATSIDALAVGIGFAALSANIWALGATIATITFVCCVIGGLLGRSFGNILGNRAQIAGGLILIGIGVKIFVEHMFA